MKARILMITIFTLLFISVIIIFGSAIRSTTSYSFQDSIEDEDTSIRQEGNKKPPIYYANTDKFTPKDGRSMISYYDQRAFYGAPPSIPHPLLSKNGISGKACLQCHQNGGYVEQFKAYAPVTPHPDWLSCTQCHLPVVEESFFKKTNWKNNQEPKLGTSALSTSPLIIPHGIQNRENCLACHAGPSAPKEIKVSHPERIDCRQCHLTSTNEQIFETPIETRQTYKIEQENFLDSFQIIDKDKSKALEEWINNN